MNVVLRNRMSDSEMQALLSAYATSKDVGVRDKIVLQYQNLVESISRRFVGSGEPLEDLAQEGYIGLITAADLYDSNKGVKFSTYATHFIIGQIKHSLRDRGKIIKEPAWLQELNHRLTRVIDSLSQELGRQPKESEIAKVMHVPEDTVRELLTTREIFKVSSLDLDPDDAGHQRSEMEQIKDDRYVAFQLPLEDKIVLETAVNKLKIVEQKVIQDFYYTGLTQTEIAKKLGISCNYVSHILRSGTKKLRRILTTEELMEIQMQLQLANRRTDAQDSRVDASVVDVLTGLYNQDYMEVRLQEEMMRASREKSEVAYLSVRIYGLEDFAERFGTLHRDELTRNLGVAIKNNVRRCDIVGRVSDWGFALILPHTGIQADVVARRLSGMLNDFEKEYLKEYKGSGYSLSIGFSVYPSDACNARDIMDIANNSSFHDDLRRLSQVDEQPWDAAAVA